MNNTFSQKLILTIVLALIAAGIIEAARHTANSVQESMDADTLKAMTPKPSPRKF